MQNAAGDAVKAGDSEQGLFDSAILINGSDVTLSNDAIGTNNDQTSYPTTIVIADNVQSTNIVNSTIYAYSGGAITFSDNPAARRYFE